MLFIYFCFLADKLIRELKKVDDKDLLLEAYLEESKACYYLLSLAKARASLTSARTIANTMYVPPALQAGVSLSNIFLTFLFSWICNLVFFMLQMSVTFKLLFPISTKLLRATN